MVAVDENLVRAVPKREKLMRQAADYILDDRRSFKVARSRLPVGEREALGVAKEDLRAPDWKIGGFFYSTPVLPHWPSVIWVGRVAYSWVSIYGLEWSSYGRSHSVFL